MLGMSQSQHYSFALAETYVRGCSQLAVVHVLAGQQSQHVQAVLRCC